MSDLDHMTRDELHQEVKRLQWKLAEAQRVRLTANEVHYLTSILGMLRSDMRRVKSGPTLYTEALGDNVEWLEMFVESADRYDADMATIRRAEEEGYAKGLADARAEPTP